MEDVNSLLKFYKELDAIICDKIKNITNITPMEEFQSASIDKLAEALSAAQGAYLPLVFNRTNPTTLHEYVDIEAIHSATREALKAHGLCVVQQPLDIDGPTRVASKLIHSSGQFIGCCTTLTMVSGETKLFNTLLNEHKKQHLLSLLGIAPKHNIEDDDCQTETQISRDEKTKGTSLRHNYGTEPEDVYQKISKQQLDELDYALSDEDISDIYKDILKTMRITKLADLPEKQYRIVLDRIHEIKNARRKLK